MHHLPLESKICGLVTNSIKFYFYNVALFQNIRNEKEFIFIHSTAVKMVDVTSFINDESKFSMTINNVLTTFFAMQAFY